MASPDRALPVLALAFLLTAPTSAIGQEQAASDAAERPFRREAYADYATADLLARARRARDARAEGLRSFELTFRERLYVGLTRGRLRRERALYHQERAARVHWRQGGHRVIRWLGLRQEVPIVGSRVDLEEDDDALDLDFEFLDPATDRLFLGEDWALHPLADTADAWYTYRPGDTLRILLPAAEREIRLVEVKVEPREARFDRIVGALWFDAESAVLARAVYRPARPYDLEVEEPEDAAEIPGIFKPIRATADYITVDYGLQELRWWLPNRIAFDASARVGGLVRTPVRLEWVFEEYEVDVPPDLDPGEGAVPEGWDREVRVEGAEGDGEGDGGGDGEPGDAERGPTVVTIVPPRDSLRNSPELPEPLYTGSVEAFTDEELDRLRASLEGLAAPEAPLPGPHLAWGTGARDLLRFNRVEGFSAGARLAIPTAPSARVHLEGRMGVPEWEPGAEASWRYESPAAAFSAGVYRRLSGLGDWGAPLGFGNSLNSLLLGYDSGLYYRQTGVEVAGSRELSRGGWELRAFAERQQSAARTTHASLPHLLGDREFPPNVRAERGELVGLAGRVRWFGGVDPARPILSGTAWGEAAAGDFDFGRLAATAAVATPLGGRWTGAVEAGAGTTFGAPPRQRLWFLGGAYTLRGFEPGSAGGEAFWLARAEVGRDIPVAPAAERAVGGAVRVLLFADAGWAGPRDALTTSDAWIGVGAGVSALDGLFRLDVARGVEGSGGDWRVHLYADGLR